MPSAEHETPIALAKLDPDLVAWLLTNVFDIEVPVYDHARTQPTDVRVLVPRTYHADGMVLFCDSADRPLLAVVLEVQRSPDRTKRWTWKLYVAQLEAELEVNVALVVFCPDPALARWYRQLLEPDGLSLLLRPLIFTPEQVPLVLAPDLARPTRRWSCCRRSATAATPRWTTCSRHWRRRCAQSVPSRRSCIMTSCWPVCPSRRGFVGRRS